MRLTGADDILSGPGASKLKRQLDAAGSNGSLVTLPLDRLRSRRPRTSYKGRHVITSQSTNMTVAEYCAAMERREIVVNKDYQRSDQVWPDAARSFLIESILLGFPIPKIYLHSITHLKSRKTIKEIVDGQQRSRAINDYFFDRFSLSNQAEKKEIKGLTYSQLPEEWQSRFISYSISIDLFLSATPKDVVQVFRRMNSYTVPLNPEELRNAERQGPFKWFLYDKAGKYAAALTELGAFGPKGMVRMQDLKLYTEILHAVEHGITTTNKKSLDDLYKQYDEHFPKADEFSECIDFAFDRISEMGFLRGTNLAKSYMLYSLALALIDTIHPVPNIPKAQPVIDFDSISFERRLLNLSAALDLADDEADRSPYREFIEASRDKTNVKAQRETRVRWFVKAISGSKG
jgi:hypothetical protein